MAVTHGEIWWGTGAIVWQTCVGVDFRKHRGCQGVSQNMESPKSALLFLSKKCENTYSKRSKNLPQAHTVYGSADAPPWDVMGCHGISGMSWDQWDDLECHVPDVT